MKKKYNPRKKLYSNKRKRKVVKKRARRVGVSERNTKKGIYIPKNPHKYVGDVNNIIFRSSWEEDVMRFLDNNPNIIQWGSEIIAIPYVKPTTKRIHRYYPDFWVRYKKKDGTIAEEIIELKPKKETVPPTRVGKTKKQQIYEALTWEINKAKWEAAKKFCDAKNINFKILTEKGVFL